MSQELMPVLSQRVLILTLSRVTDEEVCVNVIPKPVKSDQQSDDTALTTPLSLAGTPNELDEQLPKHLAEFVETHLALSSTLKSTKEQMDAAAKTAREATRKSTSSKSNTGSSRATIPSSPQVQPESGVKESSTELPTSADKTHGRSAEGGTVHSSDYEAEVRPAFPLPLSASGHDLSRANISMVPIILDSNPLRLCIPRFTVLFGW